MFTTILNLIKKYAGFIDALIVDFLGDLKSFRVQLVYFAYLFNLIVLYGVIFKGIDYKALGISFGALTAIYLFYFTSKHSQTKMENDNKSDDTSDDEKSDDSDKPKDASGKTID